jgi:hypothetical protein
MRAVIQEKLMLAVELSDHGHSLEPLHRVDATRVERNLLVSAASEFGPLRLTGIAAIPLPKPEPDEQRAQQHRTYGKRPGGGEASPEGIAQNFAAYTLSRKMESLLRLLILGLLIAIFVSLGSALRHLSRGSGAEDSRKMARALTIRISLSLALFALLIIAWYMGLISPHALQSPGPR